MIRGVTREGAHSVVRCVCQEGSTMIDLVSRGEQRMVSAGVLIKGGLSDHD